MTGVALAVLIVLNLRNGLGLANVEANTQTGVIGVILIVSVLARNLIESLRPASARSGPRRADAADQPRATPAPGRLRPPCQTRTAPHTADRPSPSKEEGHEDAACSLLAGATSAWPWIAAACGDDVRAPSRRRRPRIRAPAARPARR